MSSLIKDTDYATKDSIQGDLTDYQKTEDFNGKLGFEDLGDYYDQLTVDGKIQDLAKDKFLKSQSLSQDGKTLSFEVENGSTVTVNVEQLIPVSTEGAVQGTGTAQSPLELDSEVLKQELELGSMAFEDSESVYSKETQETEQVLKSDLSLTPFGSVVQKSTPNFEKDVDPVAIGEEFEGGFYQGLINQDDGYQYQIVVQPKALGASPSQIQWKTKNTQTPGTQSLTNGYQNTQQMVQTPELANEHPQAKFCSELSINGFDDWYLPSQKELEICYYNLKSNTQDNRTSSEPNEFQVPARSANYTKSSPSMTLQENFQSGAQEQFNQRYHWSSTEHSASHAMSKTFHNGYSINGNKLTNRYVRAVRRVLIGEHGLEL